MRPGARDGCRQKIEAKNGSGEPATRNLFAQSTFAPASTSLGPMISPPHRVCEALRPLSISDVRFPQFHMLPHDLAAFCGVHIVDRLTGFSHRNYPFLQPSQRQLLRFDLARQRDSQQIPLYSVTTFRTPHPPRGVPLEEDDTLSPDIHSHNQSESSPLGIDYSSAMGTDTLVSMAVQLRPSLPANCAWMGQGDLKVVGTHPIDAGGFADVWVGEMVDRKIAIKSYRCNASADYAQIYGASNT